MEIVLSLVGGLLMSVFITSNKVPFTGTNLIIYILAVLFIYGAGFVYGSKND